MATELEDKALRLIQSDPSASRAMQEHIRRLDPEGKVLPKTMLPDVMIQERISEATKPFVEELAELKKQLAEKKAYDQREAQWDLMRRGPFNWGDDQITKLEERMKNDSENVLHLNYPAAAKYYQLMDQPLLPASQNRVGVSGKPASDYSWREVFPSSRRKGTKDHGLLARDQNERRQWAAEEFKNARTSFRAR